MLHNNTAIIKHTGGIAGSTTQFINC